MVYRIIVAFAEPFLLLFLLILFVIAVLWRKRILRGLAFVWLALPVFCLYLFCTPVFAYLFLGTLEWHYPPRPVQPADAEAIVVLSGGIVPPDDWQPKAIVDASSMYRCLHAADIHRELPQLSIVLSGGRIDEKRRGPTLAVAMRDFMLDLAVPGKQLLIEEQSRSTHENAKLTARILAGQNVHRVILVTDAAHLPRAIRCFRKQGLEVIPSGCRRRATEFNWSIYSLLPSAGAAQDSQAAFHEWLGLIWYWVRGYI